MMKAVPQVVIALLFALPAPAQEKAPAPSNLPAPPAQKQPWKAPRTSLPASVVRAAEAMFALGMSDPRECEYREFDIAAGPAWTVKEKGWVLPAVKDQPRFVIAWTGVLHPVARLGERADLAQDAAGMTGQRSLPWMDSFQNGWHGSSPGLRAALLLRLGEAKLAETQWPGGNQNDATADPLPGMARLWLSRWYERAEQAYLRDDFETAAALCREIVPVEARAREMARAHGEPDPWPAKRGQARLWQLPALLAEAERRVRQTPYVSVLDSGKPAGGPERIAALIRDLELARVSQSFNPGQTDVLDDASVQELISFGEAAVPALLKCLVEDQRLTSSQFTEGMHSTGPIIPVYEAAYRALLSLSRMSDPHGGLRDKEFRNLSTEERRELATKLEIAVRENRAASGPEPAYATLRDDHASPAAWFRAVDEIVQPADGTFTRYLLVRPSVGSYTVQSEETFQRKGEALRTRTAPSVTELCLRRFDELLKRDPANRPKGGELGKLLLAIAAWDGPAHLPELRQRQRELVGHLDDWKGFEEYEVTAALFQLFEKRVALGDKAALGEYADCLVSLAVGPRKWPSHGWTDPFQLMCKHPEAPEIVRAADEIFGKKSPFLPLISPDGRNFKWLLQTRLITVGAFRREIDRALTDRSPAGQFTLAKEGTLPDGRVFTMDPKAPPAGTPVAYRVCDWVAYALSALDGFPACELHWPEADRDTAVRACQAFLGRYAGNFRYDPEKDKGRSYAGNPPPLRFPVLDHPATAEDVRAGRAIFSLPSPSRVCSMDGLPAGSARRASRPADPRHGTEYVGDGPGRDVITPTTTGSIWQAEETLVEGKWERYYGFVGRYQVEKVPAAEIEFTTAPIGPSVTPEISCSVETTRRSVGRGGFFSGSYASQFILADAPVIVRVKAGNRTSEDKAVPGSLVPLAGAQPVLPAGVRFQLEYSSRIPVRTPAYRDPPIDYGTWAGVPLRPAVRIASEERAGPVLRSGQIVTVLEIDLRDYFDLTRPGSYRLRTKLQATGQPEVPAQELIFHVAE